MPTTNKYNWLAIAVILLALVNMAFLGYIWMEHQQKNKIVDPPPKDARDYLVKELKLDQKQQEQFDSLRKGHFEQMKADREEMRRLKDAFFGQLKNGSDSEATRIANQIGNMQARIDLNTFHHFAALKNICSEGQKKKFDGIIQDVLRNMGRPGRPGGPPPPGGDRMGPPPPDGEGPPPPPDEPPH